VFTQDKHSTDSNILLRYFSYFTSLQNLTHYLLFASDLPFPEIFYEFFKTHFSVIYPILINCQYPFGNNLRHNVFFQGYLFQMTKARGKVWIEERKADDGFNFLCLFGWNKYNLDTYNCEEKLYQILMRILPLLFFTTKNYISSLFRSRISFYFGIYNFKHREVFVPNRKLKHCLNIPPSESLGTLFPRSSFRSAIIFPLVKYNRLKKGLRRTIIITTVLGLVYLWCFFRKLSHVRLT